MDDNRLSAPGSDRPKETAGQSFVKKIRPVGCVVFLAAFVLLLIYCLAPPGNAAEGYVPPHDSTYYAQNSETLLELKAELEDNLFPMLDCDAGCAPGDGVLVITVSRSDYAAVRDAVLAYYDRSLFAFTAE